MKTLSERIEHVMSAMGWTSSTVLGEAAGVSRSAAAQWRGKSSKIIHTIALPYAEKLEQATGFKALWISRGEGPEKVDGQPPRAAIGLDDALDRIGVELARDMPQSTRDELCDAMSGWAKHRGSANWRATVHSILMQPAADGTANRRSA